MITVATGSDKGLADLLPVRLQSIIRTSADLLWVNPEPELMMTKLADTYMRHSASWLDTPTGLWVKEKKKKDFEIKPWLFSPRKTESTPSIQVMGSCQKDTTLHKLVSTQGSRSLGRHQRPCIVWETKLWRDKLQLKQVRGSGVFSSSGFGFRVKWSFLSSTRKDVCYLCRLNSEKWELYFYVS